MALCINVSSHFRVTVTTHANGTVTIILEPIRA